MVGGTTPPQSDSREISRVLVLNLSGKASGAHAPPRRGLSLTTPSLLSRATLESRSVLKFSIILRLGQTEPIAERILKDCFHAVELILRFGDEFHAFGLQFFKGLAAIGGVEGCHPELGLSQESAAAIKSRTNAARNGTHFLYVFL